MWWSLPRRVSDEEGEALRDDENYAYVAAWEMKEIGNWELHKEELKYENIKNDTTFYKIKIVVLSLE